MKNVQLKVKDFAQNHKLSSSLTSKILMLTHEVGEIAKEGIIAEKTSATTPSAKMVVELGEVLYVIADMANTLNIDLDEALDLALDKIASKINAKK